MSDDRPPGWGARIAVFVLAGGSIAALLADVYGIAPMAPVFWLASVPAMVALIVLGSLPVVNPVLRRWIRVGAIGGAVGTLGYDIVRIPFALAGQRLFAPIESYGILIADADASSGLTSTLGWLYHLSNGVTFGIAYGVVAAGRRWPWGVAWGLLLESVAVFSPFAARYGIAGQAVPIAIAYGAHVAYGYPLGRIVQDTDRVDAALRQLGRRSVATILVVSALAMVAWHRPWEVGPRHPLSDGQPVAIVTGDRFTPEWLRVPVGGCAIVDNRSTVRFETPYGVVEPGQASRLCFPAAGAVRVRLGPRPYSGGFVYVDPVSLSFRRA